MDFYVTLIGDELKCSLPKNIDVTDYEVALTSVVIPENRWATYTGGDILKYKNNNLEKRIHIPFGHYMLGSLLAEVSKQTAIKYKFDQVHFTIEFQIEEGVQFVFPERLVYIFGLKNMNLGKPIVKGRPNLFDMNLYICTDLVAPQYFNNIMLPILAVYPRPGRSLREYVQLNKKHVQDIELKILDSSLTPIQFIGKVELVVRLHFRKINK